MCRPMWSAYLTELPALSLNLFKTHFNYVTVHPSALLAISRY